MALNYSTKIQMVIKEARDITIKYGYEMIGTEHLLYGICNYSDSNVHDFFEKEGVDIIVIKNRIETLLKQNEGQAKLSTTDLPLTSQAEDILKRSVQEASKLNSQTIEPEHLLLAILIHGNNTAYNIISQEPFNLTYDKVHKFVYDAMPEEQRQEPPIQTGETKKNVSSKKQSTPVLDSCSRDLLKLAEEGKLDPVIGRETEIERLSEILSRKKKNNPVIIGEPGTGKTAIVEGFAMKMLKKDVPRILHGKRLVELDISSIVAGTRYRGQFEEKMKAIMDEVIKSGNVIMFIDELHTIVGAGNAGGSLDFGNIIKPAIARGEFQCIGATTFNEYRENIEKDGALERRFQKITCEPPTISETEIILENIKGSYEKHHNVKYSAEVVKKMVEYSGRYMTDKFFPDKAIDVMDEVGARVRLKNMKIPPELLVLEEDLLSITREKKTAAKVQNFEKAKELKEKEEKINEQIEQMKKDLKLSDQENIVDVTVEDVTTVIARITGVPVSSISENESQKLLNMEEELSKAVIGQKEGIEVVSTSVRRSRTGVKDPKKPTGTFLFLGPTGVGKTELAKQMALYMFGSEESMIRFDMSEFQESYKISRLIGSAPGYVGYEEGGQLTEKVRRKPYSIVLFDEIEKAHPDIFNVLLQVFDDGILTDSMGRKVDFKNTIIIMTSNVGTRFLKDNNVMGFSENSDEDNNSKTRDIINKAMKDKFSPEFLNRIDEIVIFHRLEKEHLLKILDIQLRKLSKRLALQEIQLDFDDAVRTFLIQFDESEMAYGARPLNRAIQKHLENFISEQILKENIKPGIAYMVTRKDDKMIVMLKNEVEAAIKATEKKKKKVDAGQ